jgi:hypothetical protein
MKLDELYPFYLSFLEMRLEKNIINKGKYSLLKISESYFDNFKKRWDTEEPLRSEVIEYNKSEIRDKKIDDIFDDID